MLALLAALLPLATHAEAAPPGDAYCRSRIRSSVEQLVSHTQLGQELRRIERHSNGNVDVDVAGHSFRGREHWAARVGHGDQVMLITSELHGNEKHGTAALLKLLERLGDRSARSAEIREAVTLVAMPMVNADGGELNRRQNAMTWAETTSLHPQLQGASPPWYFNANQGGYDINRDFHADLDYEPVAADLPGNSNNFGRYITPDARSVRDVYAGLEDEFGTVDVYVDLHNQGVCNRHGTSAEVEDAKLSFLSLTATLIDEARWQPDWPDLDFDASRRANVAIYDALQTGGTHPLSRVTMYPQHFDDPGTAHGSFAMRGSAVVLFETSGQTQHIGHHRMPLFVQQIDMGLMGLVDSLTDGTFEDIDPERYNDIPARASW